MGSVDCCNASMQVFVAESEYKGPNTSEHMRLTQASELSPHITSPFGFGSLLSRVSDASAFGHSPQASYLFPTRAINLISSRDPI